MKLTIGKNYKIVFNVNSKLLTYVCVITSIDDQFISFTDKYNNPYTYNKNLIVNFIEVENGQY